MNNLGFFQKGFKSIAILSGIIILLVIAYLALMPGSLVSASSFVMSSLGSPIEGARVELVAYPQYNATTDVNGQYMIPSVPIGTYLIRATHPNYAPNSSYITVSEGNNYMNFTFLEGYPNYKVIAAGQAYYGTTGWRTDYRVGNYGVNETLVRIKFYNAGGIQINSTNTIIPRFASADYAWKDYAPGIADGSGIINSTEPVSVITFQRMSPEGQLGFWEGIPLNIGSTDVFVSGLVYYPGGWRSGIKVLNVEDTTASVTLFFYNSTGALVNTVPTTIPAKASPYFAWQTYGYNVPGGSTDGTVKAVSNRKIQIVASQAMETVGKVGFWEGIPLNSDSSNVFVSGLVYYPGGWRSGFKVANYNDSDASVTIYFYNSAGAVVNTIPIIIPSKTSPYFAWYDYGYNVPGGSTDGTAVVVSDKPVKVMESQAMGTQGILDFYQASEISGNNTSFAVYQLFDGIERSGIKVANPGTSPVSATIKFYNQTGVLINTIIPTINGRTSPYYAWATYAPGVTNGSVVVDASGRIVTVASIAGEQPGRLGIYRGVNI